MNAAYIHITLNAIPPILNATALVILIVGLMRKNLPVTRTALALLLASALVAIPVYLTGEGAEEIVEDMDGIDKPAIETHEDAAKFALISFIVQALVVLTTLIMAARGAVPRWMTVILLLSVLHATATVLRVAYLGGKIHHPETRMGSIT